MSRDYPSARAPPRVRDITDLWRASSPRSAAAPPAVARTRRPSASSRRRRSAPAEMGRAPNGRRCPPRPTGQRESTVPGAAGSHPRLAASRRTSRSRRTSSISGGSVTSRGASRSSRQARPSWTVSARRTSAAARTLAPVKRRASLTIARVPVGPSVIRSSVRMACRDHNRDPTRTFPGTLPEVGIMRSGRSGLRAGRGARLRCGRVRRDEVAVRAGRRRRPLPPEPEHNGLPRLERAPRYRDAEARSPTVAWTASTSTRPSPASRPGSRPSASTPNCARSRSIRPRGSRSCAASTPRSTARRRSRRCRRKRRPSRTT